MPADKPKILYLTHRVPYPPNRGDRIRSWHTLRFLAQRADVYLGCLTEEPLPDETLPKLNQLCADVHVASLSRTRWLHGAAAMATGGSATEGLFRSAELRNVVRTWADRVDFDAVLVFCSSMYQFSQIPELRDVRRVVDLVDVDSQKWFDYAEDARGPKRQLFKLEGRRVRKLETQIAQAVDAVTLVSRQEADLFQQIVGTANIHPVTNGVDTEYFHIEKTGTGSDHEDQCLSRFSKSNSKSDRSSPQQDQSLSRFSESNQNEQQNAHQQHQNGTGTDFDRSQSRFSPPTAVFVGVLDYRANVEGLKWFCDQVWPEVRRRVADAEFHIVGRRPSDAVRRLAEQPGVRLVGEVPDVRPHVWNASVAIAPLQVARGLQNKVLEAMALGRPVLATPQALEGIGALSGDDVVKASTVAEWSDRMVELFGNESLRDRLAANACRYVQTHHSWTACLEPLNGLLVDSQTHRPASKLQAAVG